jgi:hypothetical protein
MPRAVQKVTGRLLVGLRWYNHIDDNVRAAIESASHAATRARTAHAEAHTHTRRIASDARARAT